MRAIAWLIVKLSGLFVKLYHLILNAIRRFDARCASATARSTLR